MVHHDLPRRPCAHHPGGARPPAAARRPNHARKHLACGRCSGRRTRRPAGRTRRHPSGTGPVSPPTGDHPGLGETHPHVQGAAPRADAPLQHQPPNHGPPTSTSPPRSGRSHRRRPLPIRPTWRRPVLRADTSTPTTTPSPTAAVNSASFGSGRAAVNGAGTTIPPRSCTASRSPSPCRQPPAEPAPPDTTLPAMPGQGEPEPASCNDDEDEVVVFAIVTHRRPSCTPGGCVALWGHLGGPGLLNRDGRELISKLTSSDAEA
ncbi:MAG: hypothetical protein QOI86_3955 [Actinomycetota bacterium]|nr:hypothetical protein [Actinomycetota bacterium]